jgi:hypothetical protein
MYLPVQLLYAEKIVKDVKTKESLLGQYDCQRKIICHCSVD